MSVSAVGAAKLASDDTDPALCPYRLVLEHVTSRWGVLVLIELLERPYRFSELRRAIGRVGRDAKPVIPPRVDYSLTDLGREAAEQVRALALWTQQRLGDVEKARRTYDEARARQARAS
jgi:DNA-binding HxlR family transcriptional regulator